MTNIKQAITLATRLHDKMYRKNEDLPYIAHPARVAAHLHEIYPKDYEDDRKRWGFTEIIMAGWCHDLLEDTDIDPDDLEQVLGRGAFMLIRGMTNIKYQVKDRAMQKFLDRQRLREEPDDVKVIKLVDRLDNVQDLGTMKPDFQGVYAIESMALVDTILANAVRTGWQASILIELGIRINTVVEQYLPEAVVRMITEPPVEEI